MLETHLPIPNVLWRDDACSIYDADHVANVSTDALIRAHGRFAVARRAGDTVVLVRDRLGLNKLYFTIDPRRGVIATNYLADLITAGTAFDAIYAVPAGTTTLIDLRRRSLTVRRYHRWPTTAGRSIRPDEHMTAARDRLTRGIETLAAAVPSATVAVCLSGGLDSALIAALARRHFTAVTAYTYSYTDETNRLSDDADAAQHLAGWLGLPSRLVTADRRAVLQALPAALRFGQDWRDFNLHCAIVNELLAAAIAADTATSDQPVIVLTGDLMNEITGDYTPVTYRANTYYAVPQIDPDDLRISLLRGMQCGDREVGVFAAHGLTAIQPYALVCEALLSVPHAHGKPDIIRHLAGDLLPDHCYGRPKARAQIGGPTVEAGILPLLVNADLGGHRTSEFCDAIGLTTHPPLHGLIRAGAYRFPHRFPREAT